MEVRVLHVDGEHLLEENSVLFLDGLEALVDELLLLAHWLGLLPPEQVLRLAGLLVVDCPLDGLQALEVEELLSSLLPALEDVATLTNYHLNKVIISVMKIVKPLRKFTQSRNKSNPSFSTQYFLT